MHNDFMQTNKKCTVYHILNKENQVNYIQNYHNIINDYFLNKNMNLLVRMPTHELFVQSVASLRTDAAPTGLFSSETSKIISMSVMDRLLSSVAHVGGLYKRILILPSGG